MRSGKVVDAEASLQKQMGGGGVPRAVGWTLLSHHGQGLSLLPVYQVIFLLQKNLFVGQKSSRKGEYYFS